MDIAIPLKKLGGSNIMVDDGFLVWKIREPVIHRIACRQVVNDHVLRRNLFFCFFKSNGVRFHLGVDRRGADFVFHTFSGQKAGNRQAIVADGVSEEKSR